MPLATPAFLLFALNLLDALLTIVWVRSGVATEGNQLMASLLDIGNGPFLAVKIAMGTVAATPGTFSCTSGSCTQYFDAGTTLMVTATEAPGTNDLQGVTGACTASPCSVTMDAAKTVTATFQPTPGALALDAPVSGALDFGAVAFGVTATPDQVITIRNSGGSATGALTTSLTGAYASSFARSTGAG